MHLAAGGEVILVRFPDFWFCCLESVVKTKVRKLGIAEKWEIRKTQLQTKLDQQHHENVFCLLTVFFKVTTRANSGAGSLNRIVLLRITSALIFVLDVFVLVRLSGLVQ